MGSERGHVPCEHHGAFSYFFCGGHLRIAVGGPNVSCRDGSGGRAARAGGLWATVFATQRTIPTFQTC